MCFNYGRYKGCKECIFVLSTVRDYRGERIPCLFSPPILARSRRRRFRGARRGVDDGPIVRRRRCQQATFPHRKYVGRSPDDGHPVIRASYCCHDHSAERYKSAILCIRLVKLGIHGTGYRKDALRDSFLRNVYSGGQNFVTL